MRKRLVVVTLAGIIPLTLFIQWSDMVVGGTSAAGPYPPLAACLLWAALVGLQTTVKRVQGIELFTRGEMLAVFGIWAASNMVAGRGMVHALLTSLAGPAYYARSGATVRAVHEHLPRWLAVQDRAAVVHFFEGYGLPVPWDVWWQPLISWALFFVPFLIANVCLGALFETLWVREERLAFPLVSLPIAALQESHGSAGSAFRRMVLVGMIVPVLLHGFGVAHAYLPAIPCSPFFNDVSYLAAAPPWTALKPLYLNVYPLLIGLTFLAPVDVTLSVWFFLLVNKLELFGAAATGWSDGAGGGAASIPPYIEEQSAGAYIALATVLLWNGRKHLGTIFGSVFSKGPAHLSHSSDPSNPSNPSNPSRPSRPSNLSGHRPAALGFIACVFALLGWSVWTGMPLWFAIGFFGFYFAVALVLSRLMAESGIPWILAPILPDKLILSLTGTTAVSQQALTRLSLHVQHLRDTRQMLAPSVFHAGRLREEGRIGMGAFYGLLMLAVMLSVAIAVPSALSNFYHHGALQLTTNSDGMLMTASVIPTTGINQLSSRLVSPVRPSLTAGVAVCAGAALTIALSTLHARCLWWPLNPLGYALTGTLQVGYANKMLLSVMLGWFFKTLILRFGGARGFRLLRGVALGLILGDLIMGGVLKVLDGVLGPSGYAIF